MAISWEKVAFSQTSGKRWEYVGKSGINGKKGKKYLKLQVKIDKPRDSKERMNDYESLTLNILD